VIESGRAWNARKSIEGASTARSGAVTRTILTHPRLVGSIGDE
jgi:hypothetical protein